MPKNRLFRKRNLGRFRATSFGALYMLAFPRTINRHYRCKSVLFQIRALRECATTVI